MQKWPLLLTKTFTATYCLNINLGLLRLKRKTRTVEELLYRSYLTPEEDALLELLVKLIEDFEDKRYQLKVSTPSSRLLHLMEGSFFRLGSSSIEGTSGAFSMDEGGRYGYR